ncbi:methyltransferase domain-containing protein [Streptomyces sp. JNUCC 64]
MPPTRPSAGSAEPVGTPAATLPSAPTRPPYPARTADRAPVRPACPWCGAGTPRARFRVTAPPGPLAECRVCAHVFRPAPSGREGSPDAPDPDPAREPVPQPAPEPDPDPRAARRHDRDHRAAARALLPFGEPESWLDTGPGAVRFATVARLVHPYTAFDALGPGPGAARALADGRLDEVHPGPLAELAARLPGRYDVLSMFRHLERVPDPRAELRAAHRVLRPGGHLLIEGTDPGSRAALLLGRWWAPYHRPGVRQLIPEDNLRRELRALGYTLVLADRRAAHRPAGPGTAAALFLARRAPAPATTRPGPTARLGAALDRACAPLAARTRYAHAYRLIARRDADPG